jgi:hypothetical protein
MFRAGFVVVLSLAALTASVSAQTREEKVRSDRKKVEAEGYWIYNDLEKGFQAARKTGKPLLVTLRCIPCEECVKLDEELMEKDEHLRSLMDKFVRVRLISTNGLDLSLFQYDYDQSFAVFFLNADKTIYGRYGTRSDRTRWQDDVSIEGLAEAMQGALALHADIDKYKEALAAKRGPKPPVESPELYPSLQGRFLATLATRGNIVKSCIHCHQVGDAQRLYYREKGKAIPETVLFSYPHPKIAGLILDPQKKAAVKKVVKSSWAEEAGFRPGDEIERLDGQPLLSIADVQWVLQHAPDPAQLTADVKRGGKPVQLTLSLPKGWRRTGDLSWRASSWPLRRMTTGGMVLDKLPDERRKALEVPRDSMALEVRRVGQYGPHAAAKKAGFRQGDIIVSFDGKTDLSRETDLLAYAVNARKPGDRVPVVVLRNGKRLELKLPMQK